MSKKRGEVFTVPEEEGPTRNLTRDSVTLNGRWFIDLSCYDN